MVNNPWIAGGDTGYGGLLNVTAPCAGAKKRAWVVRTCTTQKDEVNADLLAFFKE